MALQQDSRDRVPTGRILVGLLALAGDLTSFVLEQAADHVRAMPRRQPAVSSDKDLP